MSPYWIPQEQIERAVDIVVKRFGLDVVLRAATWALPSNWDGCLLALCYGKIGKLRQEMAPCDPCESYTRAGELLRVEGSSAWQR